MKKLSSKRKNALKLRPRKSKRPKRRSWRLKRNFSKLKRRGRKKSTWPKRIRQLRIKRGRRRKQGRSKGRRRRLENRLD